MANVAVFDHQFGVAGRTRSGVFRRAFDRLIAARSREAQRRVAHALNGVDLARFAEFGLSREDLAYWNSRSGF